MKTSLINYRQKSYSHVVLAALDPFHLLSTIFVSSFTKLLHSQLHTAYLGTCSIEIPTRCTWIYMCSLLLYIFALRVSGTISTHPQENKLQSTVLGVCNGCGMLVHWSGYWLGHPHTISTVKFTSTYSVRVSQPVPAPMD
jgi:hypothetical protein